jgi:aspartate racemase
MKTIGMLGGMSWESTVTYYQLLNQQIKHQLGGLHSAKIVLHSVDFAEIEALQHSGDWDKTAEILSEAARLIQASKADCLMICTNTMHKVADEILKEIDIPLIHIADATAEKLLENGVSKIGLLGTAFTMEQDFYKGRLTDKYAIEVIVPNSEQRKEVHDIIYNELCRGQISDTSRESYIKIIDSLINEGAQGIILGCTEISLLVKPEHTSADLYDTTEIHASKAVEFALADD